MLFETRSSTCFEKYKTIANFEINCLIEFDFSNNLEFEILCENSTSNTFKYDNTQYKFARMMAR